MATMELAMAAYEKAGKELSAHLSNRGVGSASSDYRRLLLIYGSAFGQAIADLGLTGLEEYSKAMADARWAAEANLEAEKAAREKMAMLTKIAVIFGVIAAIGSVGQAIAAIVLALR